MELRAQLHLHTTESRGTRISVHSNINPKTAVDVLKKRGIQVLAITDHDNTRAYPKIKNYAEKNDIILINGIEATTRDGEIIGLNVEPGIEKELNKKMSVNEVRDIILDHGGEILIPHPFDAMGNGIGKKIEGIKGIVEVFNPGNIFGFEDKFAKIVAEKLKLPMVACSDAHYIKMIDKGITIFESELDIESILKTIKTGDVRFENCEYMDWRSIKEWALIRITSSYDDIIENIKNGWEIDKTYMKLANQRFMKFIEKKTLELGVSRPNSRMWNVISYIIYCFTNIRAHFLRKDYESFIFSL